MSFSSLWRICVVVFAAWNSIGFSQADPTIPIPTPKLPESHTVDHSSEDHTVVNPLSSGSDVKSSTIRAYIEELYDHCWTGYMKHAFPADELRPISCSPRQRSDDYGNFVLGNFSLTLVDSLDSLMIFGKTPEFIEAINFISTGNFSVSSDLVVSTFEANIRVLGGLLSGHIHATFLSRQLAKYREYQLPTSTKQNLDPHRSELYKSFGLLPPSHLEFQYKDQLLTKAIQLGRRLQGAFNVKTHLPYPRINLKYGPITDESDVTTTAEAGTLLIEFGVLSLMTGDESFYKSARNACLHMWDNRSKLDLVGRGWSVSSGLVMDPSSGIDDGLDSFFEYLYKGGQLFGDAQLTRTFYSASESLKKHCQENGVYSSCDMATGKVAPPSRVTGLAAFWPGVLAISGSLDDALASYQVFLKTWKKFHMLPEAFDVASDKPVSSAYLLRPELYESTFYLSRLSDHKFNELSREVVLSAYQKLNSTLRTSCGVAALSDVTNSNTLSDDMDSYFIAETLVYLYLTVVDRNLIDQRLSTPLEQQIFSTEAHLFPLPLLHPELYVGVAGQSGVDEVQRRLCRMINESPTSCQ